MFDRPTAFRRARLRLERLEDRAVPAALTPAQVRAAYGFTQVAAVGGTTLTGAGETIAIIDAYNDPYIASDLATFDSKYGIAAPPSFKVVSQTGSTTALPQNNSSWSGEIALDVEWAHAIAPGANILLVEAKSSGTSDLLAAVDYARNQPGVAVVSMSWGSNEFSSENTTSYASHFTTPTGHTPVAFVASSGDSGAGAIWPAVATTVLGVGGTTLNLASNGSYGSESAWSDSGGGPSQVISKPSYQTAYSGTMRGSPDVSYDANPNTGFSVYNTYDGGWEQVGGTSAGAPQWSALVAIADQGRAINKLSALDGGSQLLPAIYAMSSSNFHDITSGSNGYSAKSGYDLSTGRGSPIAQNVIASLIAYGTPSFTTTSSGSGSTTSTGSTGTTGSGTKTTTTGSTGSGTTTGTGTGGTTGTGSGGTTGSGGGTTTGAPIGGWGWWNWGFGWGFLGFGFGFGMFSETASSGQSSSASAAESLSGTAFTIEPTHTDLNSLIAWTPTKLAMPSDQLSLAPAVRASDAAPWWATGTDDHSIQVAAEDDFAPIAV